MAKPEILKTEKFNSKSFRILFDSLRQRPTTKKIRADAL